MVKANAAAGATYWQLAKVVPAKFFKVNGSLNLKRKVSGSCTTKVSLLFVAPGMMQSAWKVNAVSAEITVSEPTSTTPDHARQRSPQVEPLLG